MALVSADELTPTDLIRISYSGLSVDLKKKLNYIQDVIKEFDNIVRSINISLDRLKILEVVNDKHLFIDIISFLPVVSNIKDDVISIHEDLYKIIGYDLFTELEFRTEHPRELDPNIRNKIKMAFEKSRGLVEDEAIKKVFKLYDKLLYMVNKIQDYKFAKFERKLRRRIIKKVGRYDIDAFLIKQMLET